MKLYRYRSLNCQTIETLCTDQLYFSSPADFNDPMDCRPSVKEDSDKDSLKKILIELVSRRVKQETLDALSKANLKHKEGAEGYAEKLSIGAAQYEIEHALHLAHMELDEGHEYDVGEAESSCLISFIETELLKRYEHGVCCFSSVDDCLLLWSHYGDEHRGICIGYESDNEIDKNLMKVEYGAKHEVLTSYILDVLLSNDKDKQLKLDRAVLCYKAPSWKYEKEWRMIDKLGLRPSPLILKDVTFGLRCSCVLKYVVCIALEGYENVQFFEMTREVGNHKLKKNKVNLERLRTCYPENNYKKLIETKEMFAEAVRLAEGND